jgi:hypothetical protein
MYQTSFPCFVMTEGSGPVPGDYILYFLRFIALDAMQVGAVGGGAEMDKVGVRLRGWWCTAILYHDRCGLY